MNYACVSYRLRIHVPSRTQKHQNLPVFLCQREDFRCPYSYVLRLTVTGELKEISRRVNLARGPPGTIKAPERTALVLPPYLKNSQSSLRVLTQSPSPGWASAKKDEVGETRDGAESNFLNCKGNRYGGWGWA